MVSQQNSNTCTAQVRAGKHCQNLAWRSGEYCRVHLPARLRRAQAGARESSSPRERPRAGKKRARAASLGLDSLDPVLEFLQGQAKELLESFQKTWADLRNVLDHPGDVDEFGMDPEFIRVFRPFLQFMYEKYWRIETTGMENIPSSGKALLVSNHSGIIPWDVIMISHAVHQEHPRHRIVRGLFHEWFMRQPFFSALMPKAGFVLACPENAERLLSKGELVCVFPEGLRGVGKLYRERYRLARFGRGGFAATAIRTQTPILPVAVVGAEEIHPALFKLDALAKLLGLPYLPITPTWPWLGLLGVLPFPTKWRIRFGEPIAVDDYPAEEADDFLEVRALTERVRNTIQQMIDEMLAERQSIFW